MDNRFNRMLKQARAVSSAEWLFVHVDRSLTELQSSPWAVFSSFSKRMLDIVVSATLLFLAAPAMIVIAILIKLDSDGPIFYSQLRTGIDRRRGSESTAGDALFDRRKSSHFGQPFKILKFRSMYTNAEARGRAVWCKEDDPRVTRMGYILRKSHLDELPQLINILKGEMSLVGPRPERPEFIKNLRDVVPDYEKRLRIKPGLTGLAQIRHRADLEINDVRKKVKYDLLYAKNASVSTDLKIIMGTVPLVFGAPVKYERLVNQNLIFQIVRATGVWVVVFTQLVK